MARPTLRYGFREVRQIFFILIAPAVLMSLVAWSQYKLHIEDVFAVQRAGETERYLQKYKNLDNKQLLWHGMVPV